jgi:hypothetical protein
LYKRVKYFARRIGGWSTFIFAFFPVSLSLCSALPLNIEGIRGNVVKSIGIYSRRIKVLPRHPSV